jgi:hypothetical protein
MGMTIQERRNAEKATPRPGELRLKQWLVEEAARRLVTPQCIRERLWLGHYRGKLKLRRVNQRVIFVIQQVALPLLCILCLMSSLQAARAMDRFSALSEIESGDNDNAIGQAGEISRYQIMPEIFAQYFFVVKPSPGVTAIRLTAAARNPFTAGNIARSIMRDRCNAFAARYHRPPSDFEFYILWARPSRLIGQGCEPRLEATVMERARRFANLCAK